MGYYEDIGLPSLSSPAGRAMVSACAGKMQLLYPPTLLGNQLEGGKKDHWGLVDANAGELSNCIHTYITALYQISNT